MKDIENFVVKDGEEIKKFSEVNADEVIDVIKEKYIGDTDVINFANGKITIPTNYITVP